MSEMYFREINHKLIEFNLFEATSTLTYYIKLMPFSLAGSKALITSFGVMFEIG